MHLLSGVPELTAEAVLSDAFEIRQMERLAGATKLIRATEWADLHPADDDGAGAWEPECSPSLPRVAWDAPAEFALALGLKTEVGTDLIRESLEIRHRLPRIWSRVVSGQVDGWRARRIAERTISEPDDVAAAIDAVAAPIAHKIGLITLDRLLEETLIRLHPDRVRKESKDRLDGRHVKVLDHMSHEGVMGIDIRADLKDVHDFNHTITEIAAALADAGCPESLDVRRSMAIGVMADPELAAEMLDRKSASQSKETAREETAGGETGDEQSDDGSDRSSDGTEPRGGSGTRTPARRPRKHMVLHVHLADQAVAGASAVGRMEYADRVVLAERIRDWCGRDDTHLTVLPVRDLTEHISTDAHEVPDRLAEQTELARLTCQFPWCTRAAKRCDKDHAVADSAGGKTCSCNIVPLCRRHHRLKTLTLWRYHVVEPGVFLWRAPHGRQYLRDATGTTDVAPTRDLATATGDRSPPWSGCLYEQAG